MKRLNFIYNKGVKGLSHPSLFANLEPIKSPIPRVGAIFSDLSYTNGINALVAFLFAASAPVAIILGVGVKGGLSNTDMSSWIFSAFAINGAFGILISVLYRQPLVFFWTISGTVLVGPALEHLSFAEVIGAFYITGLLLLILGLSGWLKKIMAVLPMPIIMGMVAGVFLQFALDWIIAMGTSPAIAIPMTIVFVLLSFKPEISNRFPPMIGVLLVGSIAVYATGTFEASDKIEWVFVPPKVYQPVFSFRAIIELVLPLAVTVLAAQNAQGIAILRANQQNPPVNIITAVCGLGSLIVALFGCVSTCLTGPVNAILSSGGPKEKQYTAAIIICILAIIFGVQAPLFINLMLATPPAFISTLAGLALIRVLQNSFVVSFGGSFTLGALISFLVTILDQSIFGIGAPFWGLVLGVFTSWLLENRDFSEG